LGAAIGVKLNYHIRLDMVQPRLSPRMRKFVGFVVSFASAGLCLVLAWAAMAFVHSERSSVTSLAHIPEWVFTTVIPLTFGLMAVHFLFSPWVDPGLNDETATGGGSE
jgi:TRAP-type C4-dicarboxylate transport system permease small subunit